MERILLLLPPPFLTRRSCLHLPCPFSTRLAYLQVDLKHEGESDEVIYQYTGEGSPTPNKYALDEIYPEKFDDAAGQPSKTLFAKNARMRMVEYFPEKDIKAYLGGEADELMFGHSVSGYGMASDQYEVREVPDLIPQQFMSAAGLTSKELQRNVLKEKINQDGPDTKPHVADRADEVMYGRRTNRHPQRRDKLQEMPIHGFGGGYRDAAGMGSADCVQAGAGADWAGGGVGRARGRCTPVPPATSLRGARVRGRVWRGPGRPGCPLSTATTSRALWAGRWAERERGGRSSCLSLYTHTHTTSPRRT